MTTNRPADAGGPLILTVAEVAEELRVSRSTVLRLLRSGQLGSVRRSPRRLGVTRDALDAYLTTERRSA